MLLYLLFLTLYFHAFYTSIFILKMFYIMLEERILYYVKFNWKLCTRDNNNNHFISSILKKYLEHYIQNICRISLMISNSLFSQKIKYLLLYRNQLIEFISWSFKKLLIFESSYLFLFSFLLLNYTKNNIQYCY